MHEIFKSDYEISQIIIENFTVLNNELKILINVNSKHLGQRTMVFENVSRININSEYYTSSRHSSIITEDLSDAQMEGIVYRVTISEDAMTFYCKEMRVE